MCVIGISSSHTFKMHVHLLKKWHFQGREPFLNSDTNSLITWIQWYCMANIHLHYKVTLKANMDAIYLSRKQISYPKVSVSMVNLYKYITQSFRTQGNSVELAKPRGRPSNRWSNGYNNNDNNCALMKEVFLKGRTVLLIWKTLRTAWQREIIAQPLVCLLCGSCLLRNNIWNT